MEYYSAVKKNVFESVLMRWMKLEPIIQSEVSQKEKHQYSILMHAPFKQRLPVPPPAGSHYLLTSLLTRLLLLLLSPPAPNPSQHQGLFQ